MSDWNPALYTRFEAERTRPAAELLARVPLSSAAHVVDLGCGPGNSTELLMQRFADARVTAMDASNAMLASARERLVESQAHRTGSLDLVLGDIATWSPAAPVDLIYANAALQWVPDHERLMPRLLSLLKPGGVLAVQMPDNLDEPSHRAMRDVAAEARFAPHIGDASRLRDQIISTERCYDLLAALADVDVWRTTYYHRMRDAAAIVQWLRSTGLKPFVEALPAELQPAYLTAYEDRMEAAYPARADGDRLLAFPRFFFVAQRRG